MWGGKDWINVAQDMDQWSALLNAVIDLRVPLSAGKFLNSCITGFLSGKSQLYGGSLTSYVIACKGNTKEVLRREIQGL